MSQAVRVVMPALVLALLVVGGCGKPKASGPAAEASIGKVIAVTGDVSVTTPAASERQPVAVGLAVTRAMTFATGAGATLEVRFDNNYTWKLDENQAKAVAKLSFIDLPPAPAGGDDGAADETDRTASAGRHAENEAVETEATALRQAEDIRAAQEAERAAQEPGPRRREAERDAALREQQSARQKMKAPPDKSRKKKITLSRECLENPLDCDSRPPPKPQLPLELSAEQVKGGLVAVTPAVQACYPDPVGVVTVSVTIAGSGKVSRLTIDGNGKAAEDCVARAVRQATFPATQTGATLRYRFALK